jgi:hypothetical protein
MSEPESRDPLHHEEGGRQFGMALLAGLLVVVMLSGAAYLWMRSSNAKVPNRPAPLPMGTLEQAYAPQITFTDVEMNRAANFLNQQVTNIGGIISNNGSRTIVELEVTLEFRDVSQKVVLSEIRRMYGPREAALAAGGKRTFEFSMENIPAEWDQRQPSIVITGLQLQ